MRYFLGKTGQALLTIILVTVLSFVLVNLSGVDPATAYCQRQFNISEEKINEVKATMGLNKPIRDQYKSWIRDVLKGDFGISYVSGKPVKPKLFQAMLYTTKIVLLATLIQAIGSLIFGYLFYIFRSRSLGKIFQILSILGISIPSFIIAGSILEFFANDLAIIKISGNEGLARYLPAAISFSVSGIAYFGKLLMTNISNLMRGKDVFYARTLGLSEKEILKHFVLKRAIILLLPSFMQMMAMCFAGSMLVEQIFGLPGIGGLIIDSVLMRDAPTIYGIILLLGITFVLFDTLADAINQKGVSYAK